MGKNTLALLTLFTILSVTLISCANEAQSTPPQAVASRAPAILEAPPASGEAKINGASGDSASITEQIEDATNAFWTSAENKQWDVMWNMLHPDAQSSYNGKRDFVQRSEDVFRNVIIKDFAVGQVEFKKNQNGVDYSEVQITLFISTLVGDAQDSTSTTFFLAQYNNDWMPVLIWSNAAPLQKSTTLY